MVLAQVITSHGRSDRERHGRRSLAGNAAAKLTLAWGPRLGTMRGAIFYTSRTLVVNTNYEPIWLTERD
jgi:hypothetical protein